MKKLTPFIILLVIAGNIACRKYKDDSFISFRTPNQRLVGNWQLTYFEVNGVDSTYAFQHILSNYPNPCGLTFYKEDGTYYVNGCGYEGRYSIGKQLGLKQNFANGWYVNKYVYYDILKLYKGDLWLHLDYNNKSYFIKFKKQ